MRISDWSSDVCSSDLLVDTGELGDVLYVYGNRQNLGTIRGDENALWSLGVHDLSVILHLLGEEPVELSARGGSFLKEGVEDVVRWEERRGGKGGVRRGGARWSPDH